VWVCNVCGKLLSITWTGMIVELLWSDHRGCILDTVITETNTTLKMSVTELVSTIDRTSANITCSFLPTNIMGLIDRPVCRRCGAEEKTWAHVLWECEALATLITYLPGFPSLGPWGCQKSRPGNDLDPY